MKNTYVLKSAVAIALGTLAGHALAFIPGTNPGQTPVDYEVVLSGATASSNTVREWIKLNVCQAGTIDEFRRSAPVGFGNDWGVACTTKTHMDADGDGIVDAGETTVARNVLFRKRDTGGSGFGVTPVTQPPVGGGVATGFPVSIMTVSVAPTAGANCVANGANNWLCGATTEMKTPDAGFSDIEPNKFFGINTPAGLPAFVNPTGGLQLYTFGALVFNTPVTKDLRDALQAAQFDQRDANGNLTNHCSPLHTNYTQQIPAPRFYSSPTIPRSESAECMPSLTKMEIRSLFTGGIKTWDKYLVKNPATGISNIKLESHPDVVALNAARLLIGETLIPTNKLVQICRRVNGSGTQAQFNAIKLNYPCDTTVALPVSEPGGAFGAGPRVANNSGSSDVGRCLDDFNDASNASLKNQPPIIPGTAPTAPIERWAIGIQSLENNKDLALNYRFIREDGYLPTIRSVANGDYDEYAEQSFNTRTTPATLLNATLAADKTDTLAIFRYIGLQGNTPNDTRLINQGPVGTVGQGCTHTFGENCWLVTKSFIPSVPWTEDNPVNTSTRAPFGAQPNTCQFPVVTFEVEVDTGFSSGKH